LNNGISYTSKIYQSIEFKFYVVNCLGRGTDLNRLLISYWHLRREVFKYYDTSYIGKYQFMSFEYIYCDE